MNWIRVSPFPGMRDNHCNAEAPFLLSLFLRQKVSICLQPTVIGNDETRVELLSEVQGFVLHSSSSVDTTIVNLGKIFFFIEEVYVFMVLKTTSCGDRDYTLPRTSLWI